MDCTDFCRVFIDDIIVGADSITQLAERVNRVFRRLTTFNFRVKLTKCQFGFHQISVLGHIIGRNQIRPDPEKLNNIWQLPKPKTGKQLQAFLGTVNYLRQYMPYYGKIAQPLERIKSGKGPICWKREQEEAFHKLKNLLRFEINLSLPDYEKQLIVATDASDTGVGAVLYQKHNGRTDIIAIASKSLSPAQMRYSITKKELFAVIFALNKFNNYVLGRKFILQTDHQSLLSIFKGRKENKVISNWLHLVLNYDFEVQHIPGIEHVFPDLLSRLSWDTNKEASERETPQTEGRNIEPGQWKTSTSSAPLEPLLDHRALVGSGSIHLMSLECDTMSDDSVRGLSGSILENLTSNIPDSSMRLKFQEFVSKVIMKKSITYQMLQDLHTKNGHTSANKLFETAWREGYYDDKMRSNCKLITSRCLQCVMFNVKKHGFAPLRSQNSDIPWKKIHLDWIFITKT